MRESVFHDPPARVPDAAEFGMLRAIAREAVECAVRHGQGRMQFHRYWLLARRLQCRQSGRSTATAAPEPIELLIGFGGTLIEHQRLDGYESPRCR